MYSLQLEGVASFLRHLGVMPAVLDAANVGAMELSVRAVEAEAKSRVPVKTGRLRSSVEGHVGFGVEGLEGKVGTSVVYGPYVEYGTEAHEIAPVHADSLVFEMGGRTVFAEVVEHPGTRATHFLGDALSFTEPLIHQFFHAAAEKVVAETATSVSGEVGAMAPSVASIEAVQQETAATAFETF